MEKIPFIFQICKLSLLTLKLTAWRKKPLGINIVKVSECYWTHCTALISSYLFLPWAEEKKYIQFQGSFHGQIWLLKQCAHITYVMWHMAYHLKIHILHGFLLLKLILKRCVLIQELFIYVGIEIALYFIPNVAHLIIRNKSVCK